MFLFCLLLALLICDELHSVAGTFYLFLAALTSNRVATSPPRWEAPSIPTDRVLL